MLKGFLIIKVQHGTTKKVLAELRKQIDFVEYASAVTGPHDIIGRIHGMSFDAIGTWLLTQVQLIDGIEHSLCVFDIGE